MSTLTAVQQRFILHWGEMGSRWGINRSVAQIHALLYLSPRPLNAEEITETLQIARSNVSTSLKELQGWGIVRVAHVLGDRRDHFESLTDVWEMFRIILDERKRREIDPTIALLEDCVREASSAPKREAHSAERLSAMLDFFRTMDSWYREVASLPQGLLQRFLRLGSRLRRLIPGG